MEGFLAQTNLELDPILKNKNILEEIKKFCLKNEKQESCGIIVLLDDELTFLPMKNLSMKPEHMFSIDVSEVLKYDTKYIVHSHVFGSAMPSNSDMSHSDELGIDYLIYSLQTNTFEIYKNKSVLTC